MSFKGKARKHPENESAPNACPECDAPRGSDHGILCPSRRSDTPGDVSDSEVR